MFKLNSPSKLVLFVLLLGLLLGLGGGMVLAGQPDDAEGGQGAPLDKTLSSSDVEVAQTGPAQPSDNFQENGEGEPDTAVSTFTIEEIEQQASPEATQSQLFARMAGSNFHPRDSSTTFSYSGGGCMQRTSSTGDSWFTIDLSLPDGAVIDFLRVYYYDNDATYDINSELWAFNGAGGTTLIAEADSAGVLGYSSTGSSFFSHTVDNVNESLVVVASIQGGVGANLQLCGVRVRYQYSAFAMNFLPTVMNNTGP